MFVIVDGTVDVTFTGADGTAKVVTELRRGDVVGEMSMFTGDRRTATVSAASNVNALEITKASLEKVFAKAPDLLDEFGAVLAARQAELATIAGSAGQGERDDFIRRARGFFTSVFARPLPRR